MLPQAGAKDAADPAPATLPVAWPTVSVIIPIYNEARYIGQCLASIVTQIQDVQIWREHFVGLILQRKVE